MKKKVTNVHFTLETRKLIEERLNESKTITEISNELQRDRSNIGKRNNEAQNRHFSFYI